VIIEEEEEDVKKKEKKKRAMIKIITHPYRTGFLSLHPISPSSSAIFTTT
jgi:hypothetical protein